MPTPIDVMIYNLNSRQPQRFDGDTLVSAAKSGNYNVVKECLDHGANVNFVTREGISPLYIAAQEGRIEIVKLLLDKKAKRESTNNFGCTPLYAAAIYGHIEVVKLLLDRRANIEATNNYGSTCLISAAEKGHFEVVQLLLDRNAKIHAANKVGKTAFDIAKDARIKSLIKNVKDARAAVEYGGYFITLLSVATEKVQIEIEKVPLDSKANIIADAEAQQRYYYELPIVSEISVANDEPTNEVLRNAKDDRPILVVAASAVASESVATASDVTKDERAEKLMRNERVVPFASVSGGTAVAGVAVVAEVALSAPEPAAELQLEDALSPDLYAEFILCKDLPLQSKDEEYANAIKTAFRERRVKGVSALKEQRAALGYTSAGISAADMRTRLANLKMQLDSRYDELTESEDYSRCEVCLEYQEMIQDILDTDPPPDAPLDISPLSNSPTATSRSHPALTPTRLDSVALQQTISEGENSSGKSIVADGLFTAAHDEEHVAVKVKIFDGVHALRAKHEYKMIARLHHANPSHFVRPYAFLEGAHGQIKSHVSDDDAYCAAAVCIVIEKGLTDMNQFFIKCPEIGRAERLSIVEKLLDVLLSASHCKVVLNDFKPANIIRVSDGFNFSLKAIDLENSRAEGEEMSAEVTAAYCSPEVAREILTRARGESPTPLLASHKMDTMALGLAVYEIFKGMTSFWKNQAPPLTDNMQILNALARLTDEVVQRDIDITFVGAQFDALRTWLAHALKVNPRERASALELRHSHSLFGTKDRTLDQKGLFNLVNKGFENVLGKIDELSDQLENSLGLLGESLDCVAAQVALGSERHMDDIAALMRAFDQQKDLLRQGGKLDEQALLAAVASALSNMEESLSNTIASSINDMMSFEGPSATEKLDVLLEMVSGLQSQSNRLAESFELFRSMSEDQGRLLSIIEKNGNHMPLTFVILPGIDVSEKLPAAASMLEKVKNFAKRKSKCVTRLVWDESRIVFICPVTLQQVTCGPEGNGYAFKIPTALIKKLAPALEWGILFVKLILATQGLGGVMPSIDLSCFQGDVMDSMMSEVLGAASSLGSYASDAATSFLDTVHYNEEQAKTAYSYVYKFICDQEGGGGPTWKPSMTGLYLTEAPPGKGRSMWVSIDGIEKFQLYGNDAIKKIGRDNG